MEKLVLEKLFERKEPDHRLYMIVDAAQNEEIYQRIQSCRLPYTCLYDGEKTPEAIQKVAPYLVRVKESNDFVAWCIEKGLTNNWLIFFSARDKSLPELRRHFKKLTFVKTEAGKKLLFRFYDPRVLAAYLPTCNEMEASFVLGNLEQLWIFNGADELSWNGEICKQKLSDSLSEFSREGKTTEVGLTTSI